MKAEILAPAGSFESLVAAVRSGADAVYFGTDSFNARRNADNFGGDDLKRAIEYCHLHRVRCHITLNTLISDGETDRFAETVRRVCKSNADALILQDLGAAAIVKEICPDMELHASTQLSTGTLEGLKLLKSLGFSRAVLPRELSKKEIKYLCENSPLEIEIFVHGALCMCVSGQCLLSALLGSRSGNRGLCAQPCRLPFSAKNGTGTDLSLKDLSLIENINELSEMGVASFKIEGRMKRPEYVSAAVTACLESRDREYGSERKEELAALFSRSGFTRGYFEGKLGRDMFGKREKENVLSASKPLLKKYEKIYEKETQVIPVSFCFEAEIGKKPCLTAKAEGFSEEVYSDSLTESALNKPLTNEEVNSQLSKCGGTVFYPDKIQCNISEGARVPLSVINRLRREALERISERIVSGTKESGNTLSALPEEIPHTDKKLYLVFDSVSQIPDKIDADRIFIPLDSEEKYFSQFNAGAVIPRGLFFNSEEILNKLKKCPARYVLCDTLDAVSLARKAGKEIIGGAFLNVFNARSLIVLSSLGIKESVLSYELTAQQISGMPKIIKTGCVIYGRTPLMMTANCPIKNGSDCKHCGRQSSLTDRKGIKFPVRCTNGFSFLLNSRPTYMLDRKDEFGNIDFYMLNFTVETKHEVENVLECFKKNKKPEHEFTRGLYVRGVE